MLRSQRSFGQTDVQGYIDSASNAEYIYFIEEYIFFIESHPSTCYIVLSDESNMPIYSTRLKYCYGSPQFSVCSISNCVALGLKEITLVEIFKHFCGYCCCYVLVCFKRNEFKTDRLWTATVNGYPHQSVFMGVA